jgi:putative transposase
MTKTEQGKRRRRGDLTDREWARVKPLLPKLADNGRPVETDLRDVLNAIRYLAASGGGWRSLPKHFPPWQTVYWWFRRLASCCGADSVGEVARWLDIEAGAQSREPSAYPHGPRPPEQRPEGSDHAALNQSSPL